jgi:hypothetical protein
LIIATPFWQSDLLSAMAVVVLIITAAAAGKRTERILLSPRPARARLAVRRAVVVFVVVLFVLVLFIRISGRHRVAHDREGIPIDPGGKFLGDVWGGHVFAPRM